MVNSLIISERFDGVQAGGTAGRQEAEQDADAAGDAHGDGRRVRRGGDVQGDVRQDIRKDLVDDGRDDVAQHNAEAAAQRRCDAGLHDELGQDGALLCAQCLADTDLTGALGDRHQHDVHDTDAADQQRDACNGRQDAHHDVDHGGHLLHGCAQAHDVDIVVLADQLLDAFLQILLRCIRVVCILQHDVILADTAGVVDAHQGGIGNENNVVVAALVLRGGFGAALQHAHNAVLAGAYLEGAAETVAAEDPAVHIVADDTDILVVYQIGVLDAPALGHLVVVDGRVIFVDTADAGAAVLLARHPQRVAAGAGNRRKTLIILGLLVDERR